MADNTIHHIKPVSDGPEYEIEDQTVRQNLSNNYYNKTGTDNAINAAIGNAIDDSY